MYPNMRLSNGHLKRLAGANPHGTLRIPVDLTALHDKRHIGQSRRCLQRIAVDRDDVGIISLGHAAGTVTQAAHQRRVGGNAHQSGSGVRTQLHCERKKFKQKLTYASKLAIPFAVFLGEDEVNAGTVTYKNLTTGEQKTADFDTAAAEILAELERRNAGRVIVG